MLYRGTQNCTNAFSPLRTISATEHLRGEPHKSEVLLIASTLLVVKAENKYWNTAKIYKTNKYNPQNFISSQNIYTYCILYACPCLHAKN